MRLTCVIFCIENNSYISNTFFDDNLEWSGTVNFVKDFDGAIHFNDRIEAKEFLSIFEKEIKGESGFTKFTPREYEILE